MAYRFTDTDKWKDSWFTGLSQIQMLLFLYLVDNCDIAGFAEINIRKWAFELNSSESTIEGALKGLQRGLVFSNCGECLYIKNFLKHQKNLPLNEKNKAHIGILRRFDAHLHKFDIQDVTKFIEGASKGLQSPIGIGIGIGNGKGNGKEGEKKRFVKPTIEEVKSYCLERKNSVDATKWFNHYTSNGWKVGKNPMANWKAAVRTWETNEFDSTPKKATPEQQQAPYSEHLERLKEKRLTHAK